MNASNEYTRELVATLDSLDKRAEGMGPAAKGIRKSIADVISDLAHNAGKENARLAIPEIRQKLSNLRIELNARRTKSPQFVEQSF